METHILQKLHRFWLSKGPHSLGIPIEWKQFCFVHNAFLGFNVPTRWGSQLNGNGRGTPFQFVGAEHLSPLAGERN